MKIFLSYRLFFLITCIRNLLQNSHNQMEYSHRTIPCTVPHIGIAESIFSLLRLYLRRLNGSALQPYLISSQHTQLQFILDFLGSNTAKGKGSAVLSLVKSSQIKRSGILSWVKYSQIIVSVGISLVKSSQINVSESLFWVKSSKIKGSRGLSLVKSSKINAP